MARLPAREVHRFTLTNGKEPELATDALVWAIQLEGLVPMRAWTMIDPLCVVIGDEPWHYIPYGLEGRPFSPPPDFVDPQVALPPLLPTSVAPTDSATPAPSAVTTRPPADVALPYPDGCAAYGLSSRRCTFIVDWALAKAGIAPGGATIVLLGDPECEGKGPECAVVRTTTFVVRVRVIPANGEPSDHPVFCGPGGYASLLCTDTPRIGVSSPMSGYHDVPCGDQPGPGDCASPVPTIAPSAAAKAVPLSVSRVTITIDHAGAYVVDVGDAVLPNGILSKASATLADDRRTDLLIPQGIQLEAIGEDGRPLVNAYDHGWRPGTERVHVRLVFIVESFDPGATLEITDVVVR